MAINPREIFFQALNAFKTGQVDEAESLCKKLLQLNPKEVNTLRLYGQTQQHKGQLQEAEKAYTAVIQLAPDYAHAYMDLGLVKKDQNDLASAEQYLQKALQLDAKLNPALRALHEVLLAQGKTEQAQAMSGHFQQREQIADWVQQALQQFRSGDYQALEKTGQSVLNADPNNVPILLILADYASSKLQPQRAEKFYRDILAKAPENWRAWNGLGRAQLLQDKTDAAAESLKRSLEINPNADETQIIKAESHIKNHQHEQGIALLKSLLEKSPALNPARAQLGLALKTLGQQEQAIEEFLSCISHNKYYGEAYWALSDMKTFSFSDQQIAAMQEALTQDELREKDQVYLGYALGKAYEHKKEYRSAFNYYQQANRVQKTLVHYSAQENSEQTDKIIATYNADFFAQLNNHANHEVTPIFVVGLPRSGSTLQEQILASHSQIEGTQELPYMPRIASRMDSLHPKSKNPSDPASHLTLSNIQKAAAHYLKQAEFHRQQKTPFFIDKLPNNFAHIGLILALFPNAKIINAKRHPMDSCLGCYKQLWAIGQHFTYDLTDLGLYYRDYERLMQHWHNVLPGKILDVQYEDVVDDVASHVQRLLEYCELPFEQACVDFHQTQRAVKTSSSEQVRKPIYRSALAYWQNFGDLLDPLQEALSEK
ncbi:sulfotransferase [Dasania sp. GY-MA-18]|uniref:Sulfotransferase n=1 Tax=Dasania phycosphaerae TaxID=2950436 RepID=A0A9J6RMS3_9GAMM|nr:MULTISPECIES: tetratricopeptide repeat-containing sulfotransferase family protein [Dasania]MCR8923040.1 sulfotransferase [Dasania sp. GY-MA-18]MCZ0865471.1 sulfotransferase [Dasania phycosphaerae]MCZ0869196.1 sulfotransferase [Dasania phycosphaerae]